MIALEIHGLEKRFVSHLHGGAELIVLRGVELELERGSCTVLRGPSGSGKSSVLRCAYRTYRADAGRILVRAGGEDVDMASASDREVLRARSRIGLATQFLHVVPRVGAADLVAEQGMSLDEAREALDALGLPVALHDSAPATFSGGERQIVNLAIALARPRPILLLDEVTASLDPERRRRALRMIAERKQAGATLLAVFHDVPDTPGLVDRVLEMRGGRLVAT
jgi:alpha-D-ribose 1-methylphosphonate 5-triphosphate synthase subunit PhnL